MVGAYRNHPFSRWALASTTQSASSKPKPFHPPSCTMKVFVSWSGNRGKRIGEAFKQWLPDVIQTIEPFYSPDIEKGQRWSSEIEQNLRESKVGIICVTPENMISPWLMFESGAISNANLSRVCPLLFQVEPAQLQGPLSQFQATPYSQEEIRKLVSSINELLESPLPEAQFSRTFDRCWPELETAIAEALSSRPEDEKPTERSTPELIEEILTTVRLLASNRIDDDAMGHWIVLFRSLLDFGQQIERVAVSDGTDASDKTVEFCRLTLNHLRSTLNLAGPKIIKSSKIKDLTAEAKLMMSKLEDAINDMTPF